MQQWSFCWVERLLKVSRELEVNLKLEIKNYKQIIKDVCNLLFVISNFFSVQ